MLINITYKMKDKILFSLTANKKTVGKLSKILNIPLGKTKIEHFADGEVICKTLTPVDGKHVFIIQSTSKPAVTRLFELLLLIDSIKRSGSKKITLVMPYFGYSRQDVSWNNEPVSCEVIAKIINVSGVDELITFDLHTPRIHSFFKIPLKDIATTSLFKEYYEKLFEEKNIKSSNLVIVSPDHGSNERAHLLCEALNASSSIILEKVRPHPNVSETLFVAGDVKDKICIIIDDIIDTGGTIVNASKVLFEKGAKEIYVAASHAVFSKDSMNRIKTVNIEDIVITDSIEKKYPHGIKVLPIADLIKPLI
ncbi:MAG: ribose-phosphate diphosphokinase [Bacilli bacterium]|nr:ribose-phosphate diphosphokinase [Bacilli bacterium]